MLTFAFILIFIVGFAMLGNKMEADARKKRQKILEELQDEVHGKEKNCPPHKWTYHPTTERLTCTVCNYIAGSNHEPRGNDSPY
jgi:hypothetical protein